MSKYYKVEDVMEIFSDESRPENWMGTETEIQEQVDFDFYKSQIESLPTIEVSEDCISRKMVVKRLAVLWETEHPEKSLDEWLEIASEWCRYFPPSVVPSRAEGEWIGTEYDGYADGNPVYYEWICSACKCVVEDEEPTWNFCPNCGAKMKG